MKEFRCYKNSLVKENYRFNNYLQHFNSRESYKNGKLTPNTCGVMCSVDLYELKDNDV